jgi:hypothetical protein
LYLQRSSGLPLRLLIVGTYRDTDLTRTHPLTAALADFRREGGVQRLALHGLDEAAVVGLVTVAAGDELAEPGADSWIAALERPGVGHISVTPDAKRIQALLPIFLASALCARRPE